MAATAIPDDSDCDNESVTEQPRRQSLIDNDECRTTAPMPNAQIGSTDAECTATAPMPIPNAQLERRHRRRVRGYDGCDAECSSNDGTDAGPQLER